MIVCGCRESELPHFQHSLPPCVFRSGIWVFHEKSQQIPNCPSSRWDNPVWLRQEYLDFFTHSPLRKYNFKAVFSPLVRGFSWMDALPSLFSDLGVGDTCSFSKQINSASLETSWFISLIPAKVEQLCKLCWVLRVSTPGFSGEDWAVRKDLPIKTFSLPVQNLLEFVLLFYPLLWVTEPPWIQVNSAQHPGLFKIFIRHQ